MDYKIVCGTLILVWHILNAYAYVMRNPCQYDHGFLWQCAQLEALRRDTQTQYWQSFA